MATVRDLIDRALREYLRPADDAPVSTALESGIDAEATTVPYDRSLFAPDEEEALSAGARIEVGRELMLVVDRDPGSLTVRRGVAGTEAASHDEGDELIVSPTYTRQGVFDAVADNVVALYPRLWRARAQSLTVSQPWTRAPADCETAARFTMTARGSSATVDARIIKRLPDSPTGRAVVVPVAAGASGWLEYRARFPRPESEGDLLEDLGLEAEWERIVLVGAAAQVIGSGPEVGPLTQRFITESLGAEAAPIGSAGQLANRMLAVQGEWLDRASRQLHNEDHRGVERTPVSGSALR